MARTVEVDVEQVIEVFRVLEEFQQFFHQPMHYQEVSEVQAFLGNQRQGAYSRLHKAYYETVWNWIPHDMQKEIMQEA